MDLRAAPPRPSRRRIRYDTVGRAAHRPGPCRAGAPRKGASLAEVLVALVILGLGGSLSTRLLVQATRDLESAELGLRAALYLAELHASRGPDATGGRRVGPGLLVPEGSAGGIRVRYEPPGWAEGSAAVTGVDRGGYFRPYGWSLEGEDR